MEIHKGEQPLDYVDYLKLKRLEGEPPQIMRVQNDTVGYSVKPVNLLRAKNGYTSSVEIFVIFAIIGFYLVI